MKMTDKLFRAIMRNLHAYVLLINRDFTVFYTNYYDITGVVKPAETRRVGDILRCNNALSAAGGCGTHDLCEHCPVRNAIENAFVVRKNFTDLVAILNLRDSEGRTKEYNAYVSGEYMKIEDRDCMVITVHDITRLKQVENELKLAREKAENADRSKSVFLANMSHEIRTPLNSIVGFASIIAELDDREERQEYLAIMQENTELLLQLISDILDLAKIEAGTLDYNMGYVDVSDFCKDVMRNYDIKEDKAVPVLLAPDLPDYRIYTDKKRLMQVVTNFINNALKFTSEGQILLEYHPVEGTGQIEFSVTDTGMGIAPDAVATVFDRFVKLNTFAKGTGLGLSICKSIIEHLGGTIGAESELGVGSRFWFRHPCAE